MGAETGALSSKVLHKQNAYPRKFSGLYRSKPEAFHAAAMAEQLLKAWVGNQFDSFQV